MDPSVGPYLEAAEAKRLVLPRCSACEGFHWYPKPVCPHCQSPTWQWRDASPQATLFSWTLVTHAFDEALNGIVPFVVALVEVDDARGIHIVANVIDCEASELQIGMGLVVRFEAPVLGTRVMPVFAPVTLTPS